MSLLPKIANAFTSIFFISVLAACSSGVSTGANSASPLATSTASKIPSPSTSTTNSNVMFSDCDPAALVIDWGQSEGAAGTEYRKITFKNISDQSCTAINVPSIKLLDSANGASLGEVSIHDGLGSLGLPITLDAGKTLAVSIGTSNSDNYIEQDCKSKSAKAILIDLHDVKGFTYQLQLPSADIAWKFCSTTGNNPFFALFELEK